MKNNLWPALIWLAVSAFAIGTESYVVAGLLPSLAADLHVSVSAAGQLITVFALAYAIGSPVLAVLTAGMERRRLLLGSLAVFAGFNVVAALSTSYAALMLARVGLAFAAGTFIPAASAYAVAVTPEARRGRALSIVYTGLTVATVVGVPAGVLVGERFGWRLTFVMVALLALVAWAGLAASLSPLRRAAVVPLRERLAIARRPDVSGALLVTLLTLTGAFSIYAFIAPLLEQTTGLSGNAIAAVLFLFGAGSAVGNLISGAATDRIGARRVVGMVLVTLVGLFALLSVVATHIPASTARWIIVPLLGVWGLVGWSFPAAQQARIVAMEPRLAPVTLSLNASAIYLGVSLGAFLGSIVVAHRATAQLGYLGAACEIAAVVVLLLSPRTARRRAKEHSHSRLDEAASQSTGEPAAEAGHSV